MSSNKESLKVRIHPSTAHLFRPGQSQPQSQNVKMQKTARHKQSTTVSEQSLQQQDELLVFGYESKLYPPDKHSAAISKNRHLILWNDDSEVDLRIDRYDCRASLHNLSEFSEDSWNKVYQLSEEERRLEERLDDERYRALKLNELEENIRQEEEIKRLRQSIGSENTYGEVGFKYGVAQEEYDPSIPTADDENDINVEQGLDEKPFIAPASLAVPKEMEIPPTDKMHAIIEKTASFVSLQGTQMEIVLKAKQSNNSQFQFLQFGHYLNPYYKHMVKRLKEGKYTPGITEDTVKGDEDSDSSSDGEGGYLHPSLFAAAHKKNEQEKDERTKAMKTVDPDHPLAKLIEKGRAANAAKQYQKMAETVQGYYQQKQNAATDGDSNSSAVSDVEPPPLPPFATMTAGFSSDAVISKPPTLYYDKAQAATQGAALPPGEDLLPGASQQSHSMAWNEQSFMVPPPPDLQPVVEDVARRVALEGEKVETTFMAQNDSNYSFLNPWHELHPYYHFRKLAWVRVFYPPPPPEAITTQDPSNYQSPSVAVDSISNSQRDDQTQASEDPPGPPIAPAAPISFSIKPRKETVKKIVPVINSKTSQVLGEVDSDEEATPEERKAGVQTKDKVPFKRKFMEEISTAVAAQNEAPPAKILIQSTSSEEKVLKQSPTEAASVPSTLLSRLPVESNLSSATVPPPAPTSNFTAVTPSGEAASISILREKQAARRLKAMQFLIAKQKQDEKFEKSNAVDEKQQLDSVASEDIFDLTLSPNPSEDPPDMFPPGEEPYDVESCKVERPSFSKLEILQKLSSTPSSRSSTPLSTSSKHRKRSRSRSRETSRSDEHKQTYMSPAPSFPSSYSSEMDSRQSSSPYTERSLVPSAYREQNLETRTKKKKEISSSPKHRHRESRKHSSKHKSRDHHHRSSRHRHSHKRSDNDRSGDKKKKKKKDKKERKHRQSVSNEEKEEGEVVASDDDDDQSSNHERHRSTSPQDDERAETNGDGDVTDVKRNPAFPSRDSTPDAKSDGEIDSD